MNLKKKRIRSAIIGLGQIGLTYRKEKSRHLLSNHTDAYLQHPSYELIAGVDPDLSKRKYFTKITGLEAYSNHIELLERQQIDCISLCTPNEHRKNIIDDLARHKIPALICEKPLAQSSDLAQQIADILKKYIPFVLVNYSRRFDPLYIKLAKEIQSGKYGLFLSGHCLFSGTLTNSGTHMIDLAQFLFQSLDQFRLDPSSQKDEFKLIHKSGGTLFFHKFTSESIFSFELDLIFEKRRIKINDPTGIWKSKKIKHPQYEKFFTYSSNETKSDFSLDQRLKNLLNQMAEIFHSNKFTHPNLEDHIENLILQERLTS